MLEFVLFQRNHHHYMAGNIQCKNSVKTRLRTWNIGMLNGKGLEIFDELWKRNVDLCCIYVMRWRGCRARQIRLQVGGINCGRQEI